MLQSIWIIPTCPIWNDPVYLPWMCDLSEWLKAKFCVVPVPLVKLLQKSLEKTPTRGGDTVWCWAEIRKWSTSCEKVFCWSLALALCCYCWKSVGGFIFGRRSVLAGSARLTCDECRCFGFGLGASHSNGKSRVTRTYIQYTNGSKWLIFFACNAGFPEASSTSC